MTQPSGFARLLESALGSEVYTEKGRLRADDQLVRQRVCHGMSDGSAAIRKLISRWRADRVPPSTREQPFPPAEVMEPIRKAERLIREIDDAAAVINGLPVLNQDKVWNQFRRAGINDLLQFDWTLVGESDSLASDLSVVMSLDELDVPGYELRVRRIRSIVADRQRFLEVS
jgi:hypothetical protein